MKAYPTLSHSGQSNLVTVPLIVGIFCFKVELTPPSPGELGQVVKSSAKLVQVTQEFC
jgi:hypothetical protein